MTGARTARFGPGAAGRLRGGPAAAPLSRGVAAPRSAQPSVARA